ncbi:ATP-binding protein [Streptomyces sp. NPDC058266]|uniref:ATP-binding protein n=1 Tax=Streptomyces sp. NPDC058266 TaxID=3346412 RepID=UPI0036EEA504
MTSPLASPATATVRVFSQRLSSTKRGARLARLLSVGQLSEWGVAYDSDLSASAALLVAELATNAVTHGRVPGRDFELRLTLEGDALTIAVSDARGERLPRPAETSHDGAITGRGLLLVEALATRWGTAPRAQAGKTVWAELRRSTHTDGPLSHDRRGDRPLGTHQLP